MTNFNLDQAKVSPLNEQELLGTTGGSTPWDAIIENIGELCDTAAGFIDGLMGRHK